MNGRRDDPRRPKDASARALGREELSSALRVPRCATQSALIADVGPTEADSGGPGGVDEIIVLSALAVVRTVSILHYARVIAAK